MYADAVIIGAGPAGCAAALSLARAGARVILFHRQSPHGWKPGEIVESTVRIALAELRLESGFDSLDFLALAGNLSLWDSDTLAEFDGLMSPYGYGALIDRARFEAWLLSKAQEAGVTVLHPRRLIAEPTESTWRLGGVDGGPRIKTPIVIEATGRSNGILGHGKRDMTDRLVALLMYGRIPFGVRDQRLLIEAREEGWWYAAPLPGDLAVVAFMTDADLLPRSSENRAAYIRDLCRSTRLISGFAAQMVSTLRIVGFPANSSIRKVICGPSWVSIGDAAATYDPLSGRGIAMALAKGLAIGRLVSNSTDYHRAFQQYEAAERYAFADYRASQHRTYRRAAPRFKSDFWRRRDQRC